MMTILEKETKLHDYLDIDELHGHHFLPVVPDLVVQPLPEQFYRRLSPVRLLHRHAHVIYIHHTLLAQWRSVHS